ncbi:transposase zinc-binding domain-containing protein [Mediterraneibacter gnavus]|uniref:transposase zinc-binding domain-containing protein n=1 Tax=Mediterraneibacter gnavus TaxID=33038 RepID=UPI00232BFD92|nr:transposase zinc-binding domain-containing protein [Mediterraneibacter gnavus]MDB8714948.1 transposase zinc-binding domain-containing protein [Mediterraneibacter gnavus]
MENIDKMINCGDPSFGGAMYICTHCKNWKFVPFRCHSRFCPTCGNKYAMERTTSMSFKLVNVNHRHCVFTIDENLRDFFLNDRSLLNCLFHAVNSVISRMFFQMNKSKNFTLVLSWFYTLSAETSNGTLIFTVSSRKVDLAMMVSGAMLNILTTTFFATPSVPLY